MKYYAVIDTNVLVSSLLNHSSVPGILIKCVGSGKLIPVINGEIAEEYREVLHRDKFHFDKELLEQFLDTFFKCAVWTISGETDELFPDPDDAVFYTVTMNSREENNTYLVTGNIKHFPQKPFVVTPREMLDIIEDT